jgi:stage II sporulation protein D
MSFRFSFLKNILLKFFILLFPFIIISCSASRTVRQVPPERKEAPVIKTSAAPPVRILLNEPSVNLEIRLNDDIQLLADNRLSGNFRKGDIIRVIQKNGLDLSIGNKNFMANSFILRPMKYFNYSDRILQGDIKILSDGNNIYMINTLSLEEYLKGVIPYEMPLGKGNEYYEALKAFAICARTFTIKRISASSGLFDVRTDVRDQVYGGLSRAQEISNRVVDETRGQILTYNRQPATVFYSSTCGGKTEDVINVFGGEAVPYLKSVTDGNPAYCSASPQANWEESFTGERIISLLKKSGKLSEGTYTLADIRVNSLFRSGKINELEIFLSSRSGERKSVKLYGNNIRFVLLTGRNQALNSNNFEVIKKGNGFIFKGKGWGHGVGLCQWGALIQSTKGIAYNKILSHYFPGTQISKYYD